MLVVILERMDMVVQVKLSGARLQMEISHQMFLVAERATIMISEIKHLRIHSS